MKRVYKYWLPVILGMGVIFVMSTDIGNDAHTSRFLEPVLLWLKPDLPPATIWRVHRVVRKCGHLFEYAVFALLVLRAIRVSMGAVVSEWAWKAGVVTLLFAAAYAATDEFHQAFVPSRSASMNDLLLDSCGALAGLALAFFWQKYLRLRDSPAQ